MILAQSDLEMWSFENILGWLFSNFTFEVKILELVITHKGYNKAFLSRVLVTMILY